MSRHFSRVIEAGSESGGSSGESVTLEKSNMCATNCAKVKQAWTLDACLEES